MRIAVADIFSRPAWSSWRDPKRQILVADIMTVLVAAFLPWSTSLTGIFVVIWLITLVPTIDGRAFLQTLRMPASILPIAFCGVALLGMLWSDVAWGTRIHAAAATVKFLTLPLLIYQFQRSTRAHWALISFVVSSALLMILSWIVAFAPEFSLKPNAAYGVPVKNYIDQSQSFVFCVMALAWPIWDRFKHRKLQAVLLTLLSLSFIANMAFVTVSRTAIVSLPLLFCLFVFLHLTLRQSLGVLLAVALLAGGVWMSSNLIRLKSTAIVTDFWRYQTQQASTSGGQRLEFWKKSVEFFSEAPIIGHGTGSTQELFERAAANQTGVAAEIVANPHNQTMFSAIQWGAIGVILLYAMWGVHLRCMWGCGFVPWIGLLVVTQNFMGSLFNSHLIDFHEGWMYVMGVGAAAGTMINLQMLHGERSDDVDEVS